MLGRRCSIGVVVWRVLEGARELDAGADVELAVDVAQVCFDRAGAEDELLGGFAVRAPGGDELGDLALARGQRAAVRRSGGAQDAVPEPPQLARGLVAPA